MRQKATGFTLIEIVIVLVIIGILASVAIPTYRKHVVRSNRSAAESYMKEVAGKQERFLLDNRQYALTMALLGETVPSNVSSNYTITIADDDPGSTVPGYVITATPIGGQLADDSTCGTLTLNHLGTQTPVASGNTARCWN